ncbi:MAG: zinc-ribbon domain-containing protein [Candidatus Lokiarchaeota archaeon]|nr:zinc-ribbon domain-containing protein [Candidatus Lokiarchaeota archaeon]
MEKKVLKCKKCKAEIPSISAFCPNCGEKTIGKKTKPFITKKCPKCNLIINTMKLNYCPTCKIELK